MNDIRTWYNASDKILPVNLMRWYRPQTFETKVGSLHLTRLDGQTVTVDDKLGFMDTGPIGDYHGGLSTLSTVREQKVFNGKGFYVLNIRQVTVTSADETSEVARRLKIAAITPADLMTNIHLDGCPFLSALPAGTSICFFDPRNSEQRQLVLFVTGLNDPCLIVRQRIEGRIGESGCASGYEKEAYRRRGITCMVRRPGFTKVGDTVRLTTPPIAYQDELGEYSL